MITRKYTRYLKFAVFEFGSKHSSLDRILSAKSFLSGSKILATVWAYGLDPIVKMWSWKLSESFSRNFLQPGRILVWYHGRPISWKWCTPLEKIWQITIQFTLWNSFLFIKSTVVGHLKWSPHFQIFPWKIHQCSSPLCNHLLLQLLIHVQIQSMNFRVSSEMSFSVLLCLVYCAGNTSPESWVFS